MATTTFTAMLKVRPMYSVSEARRSGFSVLMPVRVTSGLYSTGVQVANTKDRKQWRPSALHPIGQTSDGKSVLIDPEWNRHLAYLGQKKLGGADFPTVPDLANYITLSQAQGLIASALAQQAAQQQANNNAQVLQSVVEVVKATGATGAMQIPPVQLAPAETTVPPTAETPGSGGGGD